MVHEVVWAPCSRFGVAIYNYDNYKLCVGDTLHITEESEDWYYGVLIQHPTISGLYPRCVIQVKDSVDKKLGNIQTVRPKELPVVQEITSVLRDWGTLYRNLYLNNKEQYSEVKKSIFHLIEWRRAIMSKKLTNDELKDYYRKANSQIDRCNRILGLDLIVRKESGEVVNPDETSTLNLYQRHKETAQQLKKTKQGTEPELRPNQRHTLNLFVSVRNFVCRVGDDADVIMALYDANQASFFSESFVVKWSQEGLPKDIDMLNNIRILFTDLGSKDMRAQRERVYLVCRIVRIGSMLAQDIDGLAKSPPQRSTGKLMRRPFGVAVLDVTDILNGDNCPDDDKQYFVPFVPCDSKDCLDMLIKDSLKNAEEVNQKIAKGQGLWVSLKLLDGNSQQVKEDHPHLVSTATCIARKMGFPEVIMPSDLRNDFYITIRQGDFSLKAARDTPLNRLRDRNIEVTMEVCNQEGKAIPGVISMGAGSEMMDSFQSVVYRHEEKPKWFETIQVAVPIGEFYNRHLRFTFKHRSRTEAKDRQEKPFAMSYVAFVSKDGTALMDGVHNLIVYAIDQKKRASVKDRLEPDYQQLPESEARTDRTMAASGRMSAGPYTLSVKESFSIGTLVCSTKLTHNAILLGLLNWRANIGTLKKNLKNLMFVDGEEVVKFLQDILDALFNILMQKDTGASEECTPMVFEALIFIIGLIGDRKYHQFRPVVETYIQETFCATLAYQKLSESLNFLVNNANDQKYSHSLYNAIKCIEFVMKFIIRSRVLFAALNENRGQPQFEMCLKQLLESINRMMLLTNDHTLKVQGAALKWLPSTISDILSVFHRGEFTRLFVQFIDNIPEKRLLAQKLQCLHDTLQTDLFNTPDSRQLLMTLIMKHVNDEVVSRGKNLSLCAKILSDILTKLSVLPAAETREDIWIIVSKLLRTIMQTVIVMDRETDMGRDYVSILIALLRQMEGLHYTRYFDHFDTSYDLEDFLLEIVMVFRDLIRGCVYPPDWNDMIMIQNAVLLKGLRYVSHVIKEKCSVPFGQVQCQLWCNFFHCAISFLTQAPLQLENFSEAKQHKIIGRYKDMRMEMGAEIRTMWYNLGQHKIKFIPEMVGPFLEMTLIPERELRRSTIPIFFDMMQCEFTQVLLHTKIKNQLAGKFAKFENEMITQLDLQVEGGQGDDEYRQLFTSLIHERCHNHQIMREEGFKFEELVGDLMQRLLEYRTIIRHENKEHRMNCIVNLLNFYRGIDRQEMYIRYLHKLRDLHLESENYTEAAYTLLLYTKLLRWTTDPLEPYLQQTDSQSHSVTQNPHQMTHRELKESLYYTIIEYFDKGKMWEAGIEICRELAAQYEDEIFEYRKLSSILKMQASFLDKIMNDARTSPIYFRVGYYGRGFAPFLSNKAFVYIGREYETITDFKTRIQNQFVDTRLLKTLDEPGEEIKESPHRYLLINRVEPIYESLKRFEGKSVPERVLSYWKHNQMKKFSFSKNLTQSQDVTKLWLEMTNVETDYPLPGILRWFPICSSHSFHVSPIEKAIKTMQDANQRLQAVIEEDSESNPGPTVKTLSMMLTGMVDAKVNLGISNYKVFYNEEYLEGKSPAQKDRENISRLKTCTTQQSVLLTRGLELFGRRAPDNMQPMYKHLMDEFGPFVSLIQQYGMTPPEEVLAMVRIKRSPSTDFLDGSSPAATSSPLLSLNTPDRRRPRSMVFSFTSPDIKKLAGLSGTSNSRLSGISSSRLSGGLSLAQLRLPKPGSGAKNHRTNSKVLSEVSTDSSSDNDKAPDTSSSSVIELTQQLTSARPKRPDSRGRSGGGGSGGGGGSRPASSHYSTLLPTQTASTSASALSSAKSMPLLNGGNGGQAGGGGDPTLTVGAGGEGASPAPLSLPPASFSPATHNLLIDDDMPPPLPLKIASVADPSANASFMNSPVSRPRSNNNNGTGSNNGGSNGHYHVLQSQTSASGRESPLQASPLVTPGGVKLRGSSHKGRPPPPLPVKTPMKAPPPIPAKKPGAAS